MSTGEAIDRLKQTGSIGDVASRRGPRRSRRRRLASGGRHRPVRVERQPRRWEAVLAAIEHGKTIGVANKECW